MKAVISSLTLVILALYAFPVIALMVKHDNRQLADNSSISKNRGETSYLNDIKPLIEQFYTRLFNRKNSDCDLSLDKFDLSMFVYYIQSLPNDSPIETINDGKLVCEKIEKEPSSYKPFDEIELIGLANTFTLDSQHHSFALNHSLDGEKIYAEAVAASALHNLCPKYNKSIPSKYRLKRDKKEAVKGW